MAETVFFDEKGVKVTNSRFITFGKTQALSGITSVSTHVQKPKRLGPIILIAIGLLILGLSQNLSGLIPLALGVLWWILQKSIYSIQLESASGTATALENKDSEFVFAVADALNNAIIHRG